MEKFLESSVKWKWRDFEVFGCRWVHAVASLKILLMSLFFLGTVVSAKSFANSSNPPNRKAMNAKHGNKIWVSALDNYLSKLVHSQSTGQEMALHVWISSELQQLGFQVLIKETGVLVATREVPTGRSVTILVSGALAKPIKGRGKISEDGLRYVGAGSLHPAGNMIIMVEALKRLLSSYRPPYGIRILVLPFHDEWAPEQMEVVRGLIPQSGTVLSINPVGIFSSWTWNQPLSGIVRVERALKNEESMESCVPQPYQGKLPWNWRHSLGMGQPLPWKSLAQSATGSCTLQRKYFGFRSSNLRQHETRLIKLQRLKLPAGWGLDVPLTTNGFGNLANEKQLRTKLNSLFGRFEGYKGQVRPVRRLGYARYFYRPGVNVIEGLGARGGEIGTPAEFVLLSSLESRSKILQEFLRDF